MWRLYTFFSFTSIGFDIFYLFLNFTTLFLDIVHKNGAAFPESSAVMVIKWSP